LNRLSNVTVGLGLTSPFGLNTRYPVDGPFNTVVTSAALPLLDIKPTIAYKFNDQLAIGVNADIYTFASFLGQGHAEQRQVGSGALAGASLEFNGNGTGAGAAFSLLYTPLRNSDGKPIAVTQTTASESLGVFSPNGHWVAYVSNDRGGGPSQIDVQPFPPTGNKFQVSQNGGTQPAWSRDGRELFFVTTTSDARLMTVPVKTETDFEAGTPVPLFSMSAGTSAGASIGTNQRTYAVSKDGQRFLFNITPQQGTSAPLTVVLNWPETLSSK
jgi:hypothetical protein